MTSTAHTKTIAVLGATGQQGGAVVDALLERGVTVRALVRDERGARASALASRVGVDVVAVDTDDPATVSAALQGVEAFFFMTTPGGPGGTEEETHLGIAIADAAVAAGVPHVVYSSVGGAERSTGIAHFDSKRLVEQHLEASGVTSSIVRPVFFMDNLRWMGASVEDGTLVARLPLPDGIPLQMVSVRDIGRVAAAALVDGPLSGGSIEIAGDELTGSQIAAAMGAHLGLPARYEALPVEVLDGQGDGGAMFRWFARLPAYQADFAATRDLNSDQWDFPTWLARTGWQVPQPRPAS